MQRERKLINEFMPSFSSEITFKNTKINFKALNGISGDHSLKLKGEVKFGDEFEKVRKLLQTL